MVQGWEPRTTQQTPRAEQMEAREMKAGEVHKAEFQKRELSGNKTRDVQRVCLNHRVGWVLSNSHPEETMRPGKEPFKKRRGNSAQNSPWTRLEKNN